MLLFAGEGDQLGGDFGHFFDLFRSRLGIFFKDHGVAKSLKELSHLDEFREAADGRIE